MVDQEKRLRPLTIWTPFLLSLVMVTGMVIGRKMEQNVDRQDKTEVEEDVPRLIKARGKNRVEEILNYLEAKYVDELDRTELEEQAIVAILKDLDPHTVYLNTEVLQRANEDLEGSFDGIGVEFLMLNDTITITQVMKESPAEQRGLQVGESILMIEDSIVHGMSMETQDVVNMLKGEKSTEVNISVLGLDGEVRKVALNRDQIKLSSIDASYMLNDRVGYVKINRFSANVYKEFMSALEALVENEDMKDLVIDVRDNPGGYLKQTVKILSQLFEEKDRLLVYTQGRASRKEEHETTGNAFYEIGKVVVLINENSASASEILAGSVQDWDRGLIIGEKSFGKGLVQEQYRLTDGSAIRITIARYYTPSGRLIQKPYDRIEADEAVIEVKDGEEVALVDSTRYFTSEGREVFAEGGITPDIVVEEYYPDLSSYNILFQDISSFVMKYYLQNHENLPEDVNRLFSSEWPARMMRAYKESPYSAKGLHLMTANEQKYLRDRMMVRLAKYHLGLENSFEYANLMDKVIDAALSEISKDRPIAEYRSN